MRCMLRAKCRGLLQRSDYTKYKLRVSIGLLRSRIKIGFTFLVRFLTLCIDEEEHRQVAGTEEKEREKKTTYRQSPRK